MKVKMEQRIGNSSKYIKKIKNVIQYHSNHFGVASLAHNKKKAIQGLSEQVMLYAGNNSSGVLQLSR